MLLLHGWTQSAAILTSKLHAFERKVSKVLPLHAIDAPHVLPLWTRKDGDEPGKEPRAWWYYDEEDKTKFPPEGFRATDVLGWPESRLAIARAWAEKGPFEVLCGFSQGAVAVHVLMAELQTVLAEIKQEKEGIEGRTDEGGAAAGAGALGDEEQLRPPRPPSCWREDPVFQALLQHPPKAVILVCGFPSCFADRHSGLKKGALLKTVSLHLSASNDTTVPPSYQDELAARFEGSVLHRFETGHAMPQRSADLAAITNFLSKHLPTVDKKA